MGKLIFSLIFLIGGSAHALSPEQVQLPEKAKVAGKPLVLNGTGIREATVFKANVYKAGLYLKEKSSDPQAILESKDPKRLSLVFLRDVSAEQIRDAWKEGYKKNCEQSCAQYQEQLARLNSSMKDLKERDLLTFNFTGSKTEVKLNKSTLAELPGGEFGQILLSIWLGDEPPNPGLKKGLLG